MTSSVIECLTRTNFQTTAKLHVLSHSSQAEEFWCLAYPDARLWHQCELFFKCYRTYRKSLEELTSPSIIGLSKIFLPNAKGGRPLMTLPSNYLYSLGPCHHPKAIIANDLKKRLVFGPPAYPTGLATKRLNIQMKPFKIPA